MPSFEPISNFDFRLVLHEERLQLVFHGRIELGFVKNASSISAL